MLTYVIDEVEGEEKEDYYIELEVTTPQGTTREQTRVEVYRILPPVIVLSEGAEVVRGHVYEISPDVRWGEKATYRWTMRRPGAAEAEEVGREQTYEFCEQALGEYELRLRAENEDGADEKSIRVEVTEALPVSVTVPPIGRLYDGLTRTVPLGRSITLRPSIWNGWNPRYSWTVDGEEISTELACTYTPSGKGVKKLLFTVTDSSDEPAAAVAKGVRSTGEVRATVEYSVECCDEEGAFRRPATPSSEASWTKVYEYTPAPGQFINELVSGGFTGAETTPEAAVAYAEERLRKGTWVSLGGWGGYIVVGFDHSIDNSSEGYRGGYNFSITGNAFEGSSEPGIVYAARRRMVRTQRFGVRQGGDPSGLCGHLLPPDLFGRFGAVARQSRRQRQDRLSESVPRPAQLLP